MKRACRCTGHCYQIRPPIHTRRCFRLGSVKTFLVDFERAAICAIQEVFPEVTVKGCTFHFRQAAMRHLQQEGLRSTYESTTDHPDVRLWMRRIIALSMLPEFAIPLCWDVLQNPPSTGNSAVDAKTASFATYFSRTWISGSFPLRLWSHFDNTGPRTTNLAEGYHSSLNSRFGMPHWRLSSTGCSVVMQCRAYATIGPAHNIPTNAAIGLSPAQMGAATSKNPTTCNHTSDVISHNLIHYPQPTRFWCILTLNEPI